MRDISMHPKVTITFSRVGKPARTFHEGFLSDDGLRLVTETAPTAEVCARTTAALRERGWLSDEHRVRIVRKIAYYARPYNIVMFMDEGRRPLGYYCDVVTPVVRRAADYHMMDLIADAWIRPDGRYKALDLDELDDAVCEGLIHPDQADEIRRHLNRLLDDVDAGRFPSDYLD